MVRYYCTYFDRHYLARGLAMCRSLARYSPGAVIHVLALDDFTHEFLANLQGDRYIHSISLEALEGFDHELHRCRSNRSRTEYIFTMTPCLPRFILRQHPKIDFITYLDADLLFFSSPEPLFVELGSCSVAIIPHRFAPNVRHLADRRGIYNVGWITFANSGKGNECLEWYRERCLEWCYDREEEGRFADQKYLEGFRTVINSVVSISHPGANLATWNMGNGGVVLENGQVTVEGRGLIFFHFQGLKHCYGDNYDCGLFSCRLRLSDSLRQAIFCKYIRDVLEIQREFALETPAFTYAERYKYRRYFGSNTVTRFFDALKIAFGFNVLCR